VKQLHEHESIETPAAQAPPPLASRQWLMQKAISLGIVAAAAGAVYVLAVSLPQRQETKPPGGAPAVNVTVHKVRTLASLDDTFVLPGVIAPNKVVKVSAEIAGQIKRRPAEEGQLVKAGDLLMELDTDLLQTELAQATAQAQFDKTEFERVAILKEKDFARQGEYDQAKTKAQVSEALLQAVAERIKRATIAAPVGGVLNKLPVEAGEYVTPGTQVAEIVDTTTVKVATDVPEHDISFIKLSSSHRVYANLNSATRELEGKITYIDQLSDPNTRTVRVELTLDNSGGELHSGQIARVELSRGELTDVMLVPLRAVVPLETGKEVYVVQDGKAHRRAVTIGTFRGDQVQIDTARSELKAGDDLILTPALVGDGQDVIVRGAETPPTAPAPEAQLGATQ
jgi:membrane fusion protein (multidrug efflux system)